MARRIRIHPDILLFLGCIAACAIVIAVTPAPEFGPAQTGAFPRAPRLTAAGPIPSSTREVRHVKADPLPAGAATDMSTGSERRRSGIPVYTLLAGVALVFWLIASDLLSIDRKPKAARRTFEAVTPPKETEQSAAPLCTR